ncbi:hypothetical protein EX30DRAFT_341362 [Ascodesmis nigricans]|uniref:REJ domain-containing protein n=1 Tax=Ascodesmis nigricans TaxID=341454 RepID=A0A4S2MVS2_9PEZI|nr:hypothetical protein EX30DRAFT_341362 [Ascodesmis nigricans]
MIVATALLALSPVRWIARKCAPHQVGEGPSEELALLPSPTPMTAPPARRPTFTHSPWPHASLPPLPPSSIIPLASPFSRASSHSSPKISEISR